MTGFIIRTETLRRSYICWTWEDYGVTKKWVIITEISKEDENNNITRLNVYSKYYVPRRPRVGEVGRSAGPGDGGVGGSHSGGGSSGRS